MEISQKLELSYSPTNPLLGIFIQRICCYSVAKSCLTLCNPVDRSPPGSSVHGVLLARILEWVAFPSPGDLLGPGFEPASPALAGRYFYHLRHQRSPFKEYKNTNLKRYMHPYVYCSIVSIIYNSQDLETT